MDGQELQKQLSSARQSNWLDKRLKLLTKLPQARRKQLKEVVERKGHHYYDSPHINSTAELFENLSDAQRLRLWEGLFPSCAHHVEQAWQTANERPYSAGYIRLPFRAPNRDDLTTVSRARYFLSLCQSLKGYDPTPAWLATMAPYINKDYRSPRTIGWLLATVLNANGSEADEVRSILIDSINGDHEVGRIGLDAIATLLYSKDRSDWEVIGKLLLAAQRQEGLRQSILESLTDATPEAFRYMLGLILEHDLGRFSSVVQVFNDWLGYQWAGGSAKAVHDGIGKLCQFFDSDAVRTAAIENGEAEDAYLALWATAFCDSEQAVKAAAPLLSDPDPARRYAGLAGAANSRLHPDVLDLVAARLVSCEETDERILTLYCTMLARMDFHSNPYPVSDELFDAVAEIFNRFPAKKHPLPDLIWPWDGFVRERRDAANALRRLATGNPKKLLPFADALDTYECAGVIHEIAGIGQYWDHKTEKTKQRKRQSLDPDEREFVIRMTADKRQHVHTAAFDALKGTKVAPDEIEMYLSSLHRTSATYRRGAIERLSTLTPKKLLDVGQQLLDQKHAKKRSAGLELLQTLTSDEKHSEQVSKIVSQRQDALSSDSELRDVAMNLVGNTTEEATLDDCLGLVPAGSRAPLYKPSVQDVPTQTEAAKACLTSLAKLFLEHGETEIDVQHDDDNDFGLGIAGNKAHISSHFPSPYRFARKSNSDAEAALAKLPLRDVWMQWISERSKKLRDDDGLELVRAWAITNGWYDNWTKLLPSKFMPHAWELRSAFHSLVDWLPLLDPNDNALGFLVDCAEYLAGTMQDKKRLSRYKKENYHKKLGFEGVYESIAGYRRIVPSRPTDTEHMARLGAIKLSMVDLGFCSDRPKLDEFTAAYDAGLVNTYDFAWYLLHPTKSKYGGYHLADNYFDFGPIGDVITVQRAPNVKATPELDAEADKIRDRLLEIELSRGERSNAATQPISHIRLAGGAEALFKVVSALGKDKIVRQDQWGEPTRAYSFSRLISATMPHPSDSDDLFKSLAKQHGVKTPRLLEVGMYAPQWAGHIERATGSVGFEDAVWWIHAHTKRRDDWRNPDIREIWGAQIKERTELDSEDLEEGAVDVAWFNRLISVIGKDAWTAYQKPAKYASNSGGHKRAQLFADAMLGQVSTDELRTRIVDKRNQDAVRALGLVPLPKKASDANKETLARYTRLQDFKRESRKFGSQRQASEGRAVEIGMQNLARTAGFRDPRRLEWAMEAEAVADLAKGPVSITAEETTVSLAIDQSGAPEFTVIKKGKPLKNVPAKLRKHTEIAELKSRVTDLRRQASRMRLSLEKSMCRGDTFSRDELAEFSAHPMLRPMIERLVFVTTDETSTPLCGYPDKKGKVLRDHAGNVEPIGKTDSLRLAHSADLFARGNWHDWQRECFEAERVQPFKQIFRELYPLTKAESGKTDLTTRYAGHQINPRQALALLKKRQWVLAPEEGCRRVYHDEGLVAELWFEEHFYTPAEVDGLTLEGVAFRKKGQDRRHVPLSNVPERIFSETMRDLDLVVSVAHAGGVDPEASASTVEMRATLLRETCQLLGLSNVRVDGHYAIIDGTIAKYSVHLGSAISHATPGRMLTIVAVHSQYRGRLFLPFADSDPKTAEVMAKTLLLARDNEIKDPYILDQIGS